jgi:hypothetical protein
MYYLAGLAMAALSNPMQTELTIYNGGFALVKEEREITLAAGRQTIAIQDVPKRIEPPSVRFRSLPNPQALDVLEQNYQFDLVSPIAILAKSIGRKVSVYSANLKDQVLSGTLLSAPTEAVPSNGGNRYAGMVIKTDDGRIVLDPVGTVVVDELPEGLITKPTLLWDVQTPAAGNQKVELSYLTQGMNWAADYTLTLNDAAKADLLGWVTLTNASGATFQNARLKLLAGDVNRAPVPPTRMQMDNVETFAAAKSNNFQQESIFEYHLYTLQRPASVRDNETKQVAFMEGLDMGVRKKLIFDSMANFAGYQPSEGEVGTGSVAPQVRVEFANTKANRLGMPLPGGRIKVYQRDASGSVQFLGEDRIDHTPMDETISLAIGRSFDVRADRTRTEFVRLTARSVRESFRIEVRNRKQTGETVNLYERHWGDWRITKNSQPFQKLNANLAEFVVTLAAGETKTVTYTVETRW